jgi:hypothetical protein
MNNCLFYAIKKDGTEQFVPNLTVEESNEKVRRLIGNVDYVLAGSYTGNIDHVVKFVKKTYFGVEG